METRKQLLYEASCSVFTLLLLEILYACYLDGSLLILFIRLYAYVVTTCRLYTLRDVIPYKTDVRLSPFLNEHHYIRETLQLRIRFPHEIGNNWSPDEKNARLAHHVCLHFIVVFLHIVWLPQHYFPTIPFIGQATSGHAETHVNQTQTTEHMTSPSPWWHSPFASQLVFFQVYMRSVKFMHFTAAWEPLRPGVLLLHDMFIILLDYGSIKMVAATVSEAWTSEGLSLAHRSITDSAEADFWSERFLLKMTRGGVAVALALGCIVILCIVVFFIAILSALVVGVF